MIDVGSSKDWGVLPPYEDQKVCGEYGECDNLFHECMFFVIGYRLPLNEFEIKLINHLLISSCSSILGVGHSSSFFNIGVDIKIVSW